MNPFDAAVCEEDHTAIDVDLNVVRLCFEAFLPDQNENYSQALQPVVSNPIFDKSKQDFKIFCFILCIYLFIKCTRRYRLWNAFKR